MTEHTAGGPPGAWIRGTLLERIAWHEALITLRVDAAIAPFVPGQFAKLTLQFEGEWVSRSYSIASAPNEAPEFYINLVNDGEFTPALFALQVGEPIWVSARATGVFTLDSVTPRRDLWLLATGTGLGPYVSMLRTNDPWQRFERIVIAHGVRMREDLAYEAELTEIAARHGGALQWVPLVTREAPPDGGLHLRIPDALASGALEERVGYPIKADTSHVFLCGNPGMVEDTTTFLRHRGLHLHKPKTPGQITVERYW